MAFLNAFASVDDVRSRWRDAPLDDVAIETAIIDASAWLAGKLSNARVVVNDCDEVQMHNLMVVTCNLVRSSLANSSTGLGIKQTSETAGAYSLQTTYSNPDGRFWLSKEDKSLLGLDAPCVGFWRMGGRDG